MRAFWRLPKTSKYGARRTPCNAGVVHASAGEARRCDELHILQRAGLIRDLRAHPQRTYDLVVNSVPICRYVADFEYFDVRADAVVVEDTKGFRTKDYRIKKRLMRACYGIDVCEIQARPRRGGKR